jgi:hypothetical protein
MARSTGRRVGREVRVPGAGGEDHHAPLVEVAQRAAADVRLRELLHADRGHHARVEAALLERVLQGERVDHRAEHAHVVGADALHPHARELRAAHDVARRRSRRRPRARVDDLLDLLGEEAEALEVEAELRVARERLAESLSSTRG